LKIRDFLKTLICTRLLEFRRTSSTRYGLDGPGIETWCARSLPHPSRPTLGPNQTPIQCVPSLFRW